MKKLSYFGFACILLLGCEAVSVQEYSLMRRSVNLPTVEFLNDTNYEIDATSSGGFELSIQVNDIDGTSYEINYAGFRITESGTLLDAPVGGGTFYGSEFDSENIYTENYQIYRGGDFQIVAEVTLEDTNDNSMEEIFSQPMTLKVKYPDWQAIESGMTDKFTETWNMSTENPGRYEYGYYVFLKNHEMIKGELCKGDYNPCSSLLQTVTISDSETSMLTNPTTDGANQNKYFIAQFHTHPSLHRCPSTVGRNPVGPSSFDLAQPNTNPYLPRFVYDYEQPVSGGHDVNAPAKVYCYAEGGRYPWY